MSVQYTRIGDLLVHPVLEKVVKSEVCEGTEISAEKFWKSLESLLEEFYDANQALLRKRDALQAQIDAFHLSRSNKEWDPAEYASFLMSIGYLVPDVPKFEIDTQNVDPEVSTVAGPQLVVPVDKARFALNAANARWGSLLDAFYGTDAGPPEDPGYEKGKSYNPKRGQKVFGYTHAFLDEFFPLTSGAKYDEVTKFKTDGKTVTVELGDSGKVAKLEDESKFVGYNNKGTDGELSSVLLRNNDLHVEIRINKSSAIGKTHKAGVEDVMLESAVTAIADFEDSVAAVDAHEKSVIYRNWAKLMKGTLDEKFEKNGKTVHRKLADDKTFIKAGSNSGDKLVLPGRVVLLVRNVGLHMFTNAVLLAKNGRQIPENFLDLMITAVSSLHDVGANSNRKKNFNSRTGSVYIVKPKMHGPEEVGFAVKTFERCEELLGMPRNTLKIGVMDEERRTTATLKQCIYECRQRLIFINTGFMDRTGDEFHTSMKRGVYLSKAEVKKAVWLDAYERWNVESGIECGLIGKAQIGKGMWAEPDNMKNMLATKIGHPKAGATCAWVPSPTAATLHAIHYHKVNVKEVQEKLKKQGSKAKLGDILTPPLVELYQDKSFKLTPAIIKKQLEDNCQSILGYVVRWVLLGVGCSKVPDINNVALMEDRATLRINSQHIANWLYFGVVSGEEVVDTMKKMAKIVDDQNKGQTGYKNMSDDYEGNNGFRCALELVFNGLDVPNGLTEYSLTKFRLAEKAGASGAKL